MTDYKKEQEEEVAKTRQIRITGAIRNILELRGSLREIQREAWADEITEYSIELHQELIQLSKARPAEAGKN